jgi:hypothetical protein
LRKAAAIGDLDEDCNILDPGHPLFHILK